MSIPSGICSTHPLQDPVFHTRPSIFSVSLATFHCSSRSPELEFWQLVASWSIRCDSRVTSRPGTDPSTETWEIWEIWDDWDAIFSSKSSFSWSRLVSTYFTNFSKVFFSTFSTFSASSWFTRSVSSVTSCGCSSSTLEIWTCWMPRSLAVTKNRDGDLGHMVDKCFYTSIEFYRYIESYWICEISLLARYMTQGKPGS